MFVVIKTIVLLSLLSFSAIAFSDVQGKWIIDANLSIEFNSRHSDLDELEKEFLKCLSSNAFLRFDQHRIFNVIEEHDCLINNETRKIIGSEASIEYKKIFESDDILVFMTKDEENIESVETIYLVNENLLWVYYAGNKPEYNSHIRYYYRKESINGSTYD